MTNTDATGAPVDALSLPWKHVPWHVAEGPSQVRAAAGWLVCEVPGGDFAALIVRAVNRDSQFEAMVGALEHARARFRCLEDEFKESGDTVSWAMCSVDADRMDKALSNIQASK